MSGHDAPLDEATIESRCLKEGVQYTDVDFPPNERSLGTLEGDSNGGNPVGLKWMRVTEMDGQSNTE